MLKGLDCWIVDEGQQFHNLAISLAMSHILPAATEYVHGYSGREHERLHDQARTLTELLHHDTHYPAGSHVLEAGCGVGAQTVTLARNSPDALLTSIELSAESLAHAYDLAVQHQLANVVFRQADIFNLPFANECFDHIFLCFVLEHLPNPEEALLCLKRVLRPGGTITVIEGDHDSAYFYPYSEAAREAIQCLVTLQAQCGGNALIGRQVFPLLAQAGFSQVRVSPRMVYVDASQPGLVEGFIKNTFTAMVEGVGDQVMAAGLMSPQRWAQGIADLYRTTQPDGVFCYTFFKGVATRSSSGVPAKSRC